MKLKVLLLLSSIITLNSCNTNKKSQVQTLKSASDSTEIVLKNSYTAVKEKSYKWIKHFDLDIDYIANKKLGDKKHLAEFLGFYWKMYQTTNDPISKEKIRKRLTPYYQYTQERKYHNMRVVDDKLFKKNSMSYLRVMWLLKELDFDISNYKKELMKVKGRMDNHLKTRGAWQKEVFKEYYTFFDLKMPSFLESTKLNNGIINTQLPFDQYKKNTTYNLTHFVFAGFEYGNKTIQTRFNQQDLDYLKNILPQLSQYYRETQPNIDLLGELVTCMVFLGNTDTEEFRTSYKYLLENQNKNGSWGNYEKHRKKLGDDVEFRAYLHTSLVVLEGLLAYNEGDFAGSL